MSKASGSSWSTLIQSSLLLRPFLYIHNNAINKKKMSISSFFPFAMLLYHASATSKSQGDIVPFTFRRTKHFRRVPCTSIMSPKRPFLFNAILVVCSNDKRTDKRAQVFRRIVIIVTKCAYFSSFPSFKKLVSLVTLYCCFTCENTAGILFFLLVLLL